MLRDEVDYIEDGDSFIDLRRLLEDSDGFMDHVHELRDLYTADLVHIVVGRSVNVSGVAASIGGDESGGFALTVSYGGGLVFAHELGHNMGLYHDRYKVGVPAEGSHYGYVNQRMFDEGAPESARWRTIMAFPNQCPEVGGFSCPWVPYFSNPDLTYNGDPMGVPADHPSTGVDGPADAVRTLNERREITANFRRSSTSPTPRVHLTLSPYWLSENGGMSTVTATLHKLSSSDTTVTVTASPSDAVTLSANRVVTIPAGQTVSRGAVTITGVDNGVQTGDVTVMVSAIAKNPSSMGVVEPEPVALAVADDETTPVVTLSLSPAEIVEIDGLTFVTAMLDNRSVADTAVTVSATPADAVEEISSDPLTIPAGQRTSIGYGVSIQAVDNDELAEATQTVTVSGTSENAQGVAGPENVTLTIIDDEAPFFAADSIAYTFTEGLAGRRFLPEAAYGKGPLTYSLSPAPSNGVTFTPGPPPVQIGTSATSAAGPETSYTLTVTDADGVKDTMTISITVRKGVCSNSAAVSGYTNPGIVDDCEALLVSRDVLGGGKSLNWSEDISIGEWEGVLIVHGRVVLLIITTEGLTGTIPSELGSLSSLEWLWLWTNQLTGGIPKELGSLSNLQSLALGRNQLTGEIPAELGSLSNLEFLALWGNQLTGEIPKELGSLSNLELLELGRNQLTGEIPKELGNLANLQSLYLSDNQLTGEIPKELGSLANLQRLYLWGNRLTGEIPKELGNLANLQDLYLNGNLLTGCVPDGLRDVPRNDFARLRLPFCSEVSCVNGGAVSDTTNLGLLSDCGTLLAARDSLAGTATLNWSGDIPIADWNGVVVGGTPGRATELRLSGLGLTGQIPPELGDLPDLQHLDLRDNQLAGGIPTELGDLVNLQELYLDGNRLTGCVPDGLRDVPNNDFARLGLPFCSEHPCVNGGAVSDTTNLGLLSDCETLLAARDTLAGTASLNWSADTPITEWNGVVLGGTHGHVTELDLGAMGLNGGIPEELGSLANLQWLDLGGNQLTGEIPPELGRLSNLTYLSLYGNQLTGEIPPELGHLSNLTELWLGDNQLTGEIPPELGRLSNLTELWLRDNQLTGEIPPELGRLSNLTRLYLQGNQLTGGIPKELGNLANLTRLYLHGNQLTGGIPKELGNLANLQVLSLNDNQLTGVIPKELENLSNLRWLVLGGNLLTGCVPDGLRDVPNNDFVKLGLPFCSEHPCVSGGAVVDATNEGLASDCGMLLAARDTLAGTASLNWSADTPITEWNGVVLGGTHGHVTELDLGALGLNGRIPKELGSLANLMELVLADNQLTGEIPPELGGLSNLEWLDIASNQLTGTIPKELGSLANLQGLWLWSNQLTGEIPKELGSLANLQGLYLSDNQLTGEIPKELGNLSNLQELNLFSNQLTGEIPAELGNLAGLTDLYLANNQFTGCIPDELLRFQDTTNNDLDMLGLAFCEGLPGAPSIEEVTVGTGALAGYVVVEWSAPASDGASAITAYDLRYIETAADETVDSNWTVVEDVWTTGSGDLQYTLTGLTADTEYDLQLRAVNAVGDGPWSATVTGTPTAASACVTGGAVSDAANTGLVSDCEALLAAEAILAVSVSLNWAGDTPIAQWDGIRLGGASRRVTRLALPGKGLGGTVPSQLGELSMLTDLNLRTNGLSGQIPAELGDLSSLVRLNLHTNQLTGPIPDLGGLTGLEEMYLARNMLTGPVPAWLNGMTEMRELWLWGNELSGTIPDLSGMTSLEKLKLAANNLEGGVPGASALPANLRWLIIQENPLGGTIPDLSGMTRLAVLWLHTNGLTGEVPAPHLPPSLTSLNLHSNELSGVIPDLSGLDRLQWLRLQGNQLSGTIPSTLGEMESLTRLWLHENMLSGSIPAWLGGLTKLQRLWLSDNMLSGEIPEELGELGGHSLVQWRLAGNDITGCVPAGLAGVEDGDLERLGLLVCSDS